jgi:hypothetical protein
MLMESKTLQQSTSYTVGYCREYKMNNAFLVKAEKWTLIRILHQSSFYDPYTYGYKGYDRKGNRRA